MILLSENENKQYMLLNEKIVLDKSNIYFEEEIIAEHYFKTNIYTDFYSTSKRNLIGDKYVSKKLKTYKLNQSIIGFNTPIYTEDYYKKDSTRISNIHLLLTGSYAVVSPIFSGISNHHLSKTSIGVRMIYNSGKSGSWFLDFSPFVTQDNGYNYTKRYRAAYSIIYNYTYNKNASIRVGLTRTFTFGNRFFIPYVGLRLGSSNGFNFNFQFPRSISINFPIGKNVRTSIYAKPQGGVYSFANTDELYYLNNDRNINFGRYEYLLGSRFDFHSNKLIGFYLGAGISSQNGISLFSETYNKNNNGKLNHFYAEKLTGALFVNIGLTVKFGKTKSIYNNYNLYDAIDLNNSLEAGDNNINTGNLELPNKKTTVKDVHLSDMQDLIETQDLY
jgi:hypothetical protein